MAAGVREGLYQIPFPIPRRPPLSRTLPSNRIILPWNRKFHFLITKGPTAYLPLDQLLQMDCSFPVSLKEQSRTSLLLCWSGWDFLVWFLYPFHHWILNIYQWYIKWYKQYLLHTLRVPACSHLLFFSPTLFRKQYILPSVHTTFHTAPLSILLLTWEWLRKRTQNQRVT